MITKGDKILFFSIILISFIIFVSFQVYGFADGKSYVLIEVNGKLYQKVSLGETGPNLKISVPVANGENIVEIERDRVRMLSAQCPDQDCIRQGWINRPGQMIVCLPNKMVIKIQSDKSIKEDVDIITF
ncbi:MAG TPA: NusG domain II-containing protein [Thermoanaerobacterales bacterium]|uniref:NusG domain II-containing protein n=1 Tax=Tepidanaerobacter sp. GT38 TaxID=2722793 RepID=UPI001830DBDE|nr:NusG domain II-containing protein [Tepidanaerobacter sp. GT38]MCG1012759.1 NusG domain II-containing protein [Tepidanaerobacter sp. GT38]HHY41887.1 NusG domain II-containing protein [Thermoanaerobacterales bacterium]